MDPHNIAMEGFFVLGERSRNTIDKQFIQSTIERVFNVKLDIEAIYEAYFTEKLETIFDRVPAELNLPKIIPSKQLKRLAVLVEKCLRNREPVLLVGETGCGKTTLC
jgi:midasin